jgi:signal transduction histidine kinase
MMGWVDTDCPPLGTLNANPGEATPMSDGSRAGRRHRRHRPAHPRRGRRDHRREVSRVDDEDSLEEIDDSLLTPEERSYRAVRAKAEEKAELYIEAAKKGALVLVLLVIPPLTWLGFILLLVWGLGMGRRLFQALVEPGLRERLVEDEVAKHVDQGVHRARRSLEGEHARSMEELAASIAHEIRNPITAAKSLVQQMGEAPESIDNPEYAAVALQELERVERSITHLLRFARDEELRSAELCMVDVLDSALETFRERSARGGVEIARQFDCRGELVGDAEKLRRVIINLVGNAIDALEEAQVDNPCVEVSMGENLAGSEIWVRIRDNGVGIDPDTAAKIFSPFVTAKAGGTGLGLAITKKLVESHGGSIELFSEPGQGAEFVLSFPKAPGSSRGGS